MGDAYFVLVFALCLGLSAAFFYIAHKGKSEKKFCIIAASLLLFTSILLVFGLFLDSQKMIIIGFILFFGIVMLLFPIHILKRVKKCNFEINAKYMSYQERKRPGSVVKRYSPKFLYYYEGEEITAYSFLSYSARKFIKLYEGENEYVIYINPDNPHQCVDKRVSPPLIVPAIIMSIFLIGLCVFLVLMS